MTEAQGTELLEKISSLLDLLKVSNSVLLALFGAAAALVFFAALKAVRRS